MKFIKLTTFAGSGYYNIHYFYEFKICNDFPDEEKFKTIVMAKGNYYYVKETPEEILKLINGED